MKTRAECISYSNYESHTEHNFSNGFPVYQQTTPLQVCKGELIWFLRGDTHIKYLLDNGILYGTKMPTTLYVKVTSANLDSDANHMYRKT
jgi:thymidylate synthase